MMLALAVLLRPILAAPSIDPVHAANITVYHVNEHSFGAIPVNMNTHVTLPPPRRLGLPNQPPTSQAIHSGWRVRVCGCMCVCVRVCTAPPEIPSSRPPQRWCVVCGCGCARL